MNEIATGLTGGMGILMLVVAGLALVLYLVPIPLWIAAWASGAYVGLFTLVGMRLRRVPPATIVTARISSRFWCVMQLPPASMQSSRTRNR